MLSRLKKNPVETEKKEMALLRKYSCYHNHPRLSDTMEEGTVASWFKIFGDSVD